MWVLPPQYLCRGTPNIAAGRPPFDLPYSSQSTKLRLPVGHGQSLRLSFRNRKFEWLKWVLVTVQVLYRPAWGQSVDTPSNLRRIYLKSHWHDCWQSLIIFTVTTCVPRRMDPAFKPKRGNLKSAALTSHCKGDRPANTHTHTYTPTQQRSCESSSNESHMPPAWVSLAVRGCTVSPGLC